MNATWFIGRLSRNAEFLSGLVSGVDREQARWKPDPESWSVLEVVNHLYDEERDDFRRRLDLTLHHPEEPWPGIDPEAWCVEREYNQRELGESEQRFRKEREESITWLETLKSPDWNRVHRHPRLGELRAGDILASWTVHDLLHGRQLIKLQYAYSQRQIGVFASRYAGRW